MYRFTWRSNKMAHARDWLRLGANDKFINRCVHPASCLVRVIRSYIDVMLFKTKINSAPVLKYHGDVMVWCPG